MKKTWGFLFLIIWLIFASGVEAQGTVIEGRVFQVREEKIITSEGEEVERQNLEVELLCEDQKGERVLVTTQGTLLTGKIEYQKGDLVLLEKILDEQGKESYLITDFVRRGPLLGLFFLFAILVIAIGGRRGATALLGLIISFLVIALFLVPQIAKGSPPLLITIISSLIIIPLTFYLSHGFNRKTSLAGISTILTLALAGYLSYLAVEVAHLTGLVSEEVGFLQAVNPGLYDVGGLLLAGIFLGLLGVLDDVTVSQAAVVEQLRQINPQLSSKDLFLKSMKVGKDHIASMVNTLILVYAGASLPLLLLFSQSSEPFWQVINFEIIAEEIVRMLVGSISLVLAVPLTTFLASGYPTPPISLGKSGRGFKKSRLQSFGGFGNNEDNGKRRNGKRASGSIGS